MGDYAGAAKLRITAGILISRTNWRRPCSSRPPGRQPRARIKADRIDADRRYVTEPRYPIFARIVCAIDLLGGTAVSASAKTAGESVQQRANGHAGHAAGHGSAGHGPPVGFAYDHTAPKGTFCQPGVCLKSAP
jgi:hypothetical protein